MEAGERSVHTGPVAGCADGCRAGALRFTSVSKGKPPGVADEEVSYELLGQGAHPDSYTVIRVGSTGALFTITTKTGTDGVVNRTRRPR